MKMLALMKYGDRAASTRQRLLQYEPHLAAAGIQVTAAPLLDNEYLAALFSNEPKSYRALFKAYAARVRHVAAGRTFDAVWVHCETFPYLPGLFERLVTAFARKTIYDYDDAIFHQYDSHPNPVVRRLLGRKLEPLLRRADLAICGNDYLKSYAARFCARTEIVPTVLDTSVYLPPPRHRDEGGGVVVGWIGSPSTWKFMQPLLPVLDSLVADLGIVVRVVGAGAGVTARPGFEFVEWSEPAEVGLIQGMDIGVMPLPDEPWARGKCGYKLIQYMACGLPVVASPVGVNAQIVDAGRNGLLAATPGEWDAALRRLVADAPLRGEWGAMARQKVEASYSLQVHGPRLAAMLSKVVGV
jgi:glycosyltransferase involved in cell wall biosynthesis